MANLKQWAQLGAAQRVAEITAELAAIRSAFPELASRRRVQSGGGGGTLAHEPHKRRRKPMSAAQRKAVSGWMKKYWAGRRKANA
jgi:hypothetical protein